MAFTAKTRVEVADAGDGQAKLTFTANYTDPDTGERVNQEWAKYTPGFSLSMWVLNEVVEANKIESGQPYTLTLAADEDYTPKGA